MRFTTIIIITAILTLFISCSKEDTINQAKDQDCTTDFQDHPRQDELQLLANNYTSDGFAGMILLTDHPTDGLCMVSSGYSNIDDETAMNPCNVLYVASLYKTYTATIIMQLVEENKIELTDNLSKYVASNITDKLPNGSSITIKNLLQQRTGIPDIFGDDFLNNFFSNPTKQYTIEELLEYVYDKDPLSDVDTEFHYSDANFSLLTLVIENIEGNFRNALESRIINALELNDTYFIEDSTPVPTELTSTYWDLAGNGILEDNSVVQYELAKGLEGSDGILSTVDDIKTFLQAISSNLLVSEESLSLMTDFLDLPEEVQESVVYSGYGMGLMKVNISGEEWYGHFGNQIGAGAIMLYNAERDLTFIALQNTGTFFSEEITIKFFFQLIADIESILI